MALSLTNMRNTILILEDDEKRLRRLLDVLAKQQPKYAVAHWSDAHAMIRELPTELRSAALLCLDHDLYVQDKAAPDPGDGLDVANYLAGLQPCCPVLIHSSNSYRSNMMLGELQLAGWPCRRIAPIGDDWIEAYWAFVVDELLNGSQIPHCG